MTAVDYNALQQSKRPNAHMICLSNRKAGKTASYARCAARLQHAVQRAAAGKWTAHLNEHISTLAALQLHDTQPPPCMDYSGSGISRRLPCETPA